MLFIAGFFFIAIIYSSVGFGGGSSYLAILSQTSIDYRYIPIIALCCNLIVVMVSYKNFQNITKLPKITYVIMLGATPFALLGSLFPISETLFFSVLAIALIVSGIMMVLQSDNSVPVNSNIQLQPVSIGLLTVICIPVSFLAGLVGIGGGIFLAPVLHLVKFANAKHIATITAIYILLNSISGLIGQLWKVGSHYPNMWHEIYVNHLYILPIIVAIGAQIGSYVGAFKLNLRWLKTACGSLIIVVGVRIGYQSLII